MAEFRTKAGRKFVAELMRPRYHEKVAAIGKHLSAHNLALARFVSSRFAGTFEGTRIPKAALIQGLLNDEIELSHWAFIRAKLRNLAHLTDRRHPEEYALDIALGWIAEEWFREELDKQAGKKGAVTLIGIDSEREYCSLGIRANADFSIKRKNGKATTVDLMVDYHGTWQRNGYIDLKKGKVGHLMNGTVDSVLGFDVQRSLLYIVDKSQLAGLGFSANAAMGGNLTLNVPLPKPISLQKLYRAL